MPISQEDFRKGMQQLAATVTIITAAFNGERSGLTATAVSSVSNDPPSLLICVNKDCYTHGIIQKSKRFTVNLLTSQHQAISNAFASPVEQPEDKFKTGNWVTNEQGLPILEDALSSFSCAVIRRINTNTHSIFIGKIEALQVKEELPLIYANRGYKTLQEL